MTIEQAAEFRALLESSEARMLQPDKEEHPFTYCMEVVVPAMAREDKEPSDPKAFCGWWKEDQGFTAAEANVDFYDQSVRHLHLCGATGEVRFAMHEGREHIVVPVVALMEEVIHAVNADVPEYVPLATLAKAAASWNGRPVMLGHPVKNGRQCSANAPDVMASHGIGTIFNSRMDGKRLLQEAWIDREKVKRLHLKLHDRLLEGKPPVEVSVGAHVVTGGNPSTWNGKTYKAAWLEASGDHLAFLPDGRGACSSEMGCGALRAASYKVEGDALVAQVWKKHEVKMCECAHLGTMRTLLDEAETLLGEASGYVDELMEADESPSASADSDKLEAIETLGMQLSSLASAVIGLTYKKRAPHLNVVPPSSSAYPTYLEEFRAAVGRSISAKNMKVIQASHDAAHSMHDHTTALGAECNGMRLLEPMRFATPIDGSQLSKIGEKIHEALAAYKDCTACEGTGSKDGNPCEACNGEGKLKSTQQRTAEEIDRELMNRAAAGDAAFRAACRCQEGDRTMTKEAREAIIKALVANKYSGFTAGDEKILEGATDERLESFRVAAESRAQEEEQLRAAASKKMTTEEFMAAAPPDLKALLDRQQRQETELKAALITELRTAQGEYSEAELSVKPIDELQRMARMVKVDPVKFDFSGRGVPVARGAEEKDDYTPPDPYERDIKAAQARIN